MERHPALPGQPLIAISDFCQTDFALPLFLLAAWLSDVCMACKALLLYVPCMCAANVFVRVLVCDVSYVDVELHTSN